MTYRDDLQAARMRREALRRELRQVRSRMHEHLELTKQEQALEQELAQCAQDIDQARARAELPLLQRLHVATPCKEHWDDMTGDERVRFCGRCAKNVYDLSALTASQAEELLRERGESLCVRFFRRSDGTILTSDCPTGRQRKRFWRRVTTAAVASGLAAAGLTMAPTTMESATAGDTTHESLRPDVVALKNRLQGGGRAIWRARRVPGMCSTCARIATATWSKARAAPFSFQPGRWPGKKRPGPSRIARAGTPRSANTGSSAGTAESAPLGNRDLLRRQADRCAAGRREQGPRGGHPHDYGCLEFAQQGALGEPSVADNPR